MDFSNMKVLVIGDICLDILEEGTSTRISPEAPVPVILNSVKNYSLGMAGNVAVNLKNLGANVSIASYTIDDKYGKKIFSLLNKHQIHYDKKKYYRNSLPISATTTVKKRILANGHQIVRLDKEFDISKNQGSVNNIIHAWQNYDMGEYDLVVIADYNKGYINPETWKTIKKVIKDEIKPKHVFVDTKKMDVLKYYEDCIITPNTSELNSIMERYQFSKQFLLSNLFEAIIETASEKGAYAYNNEGKYFSPAQTTDIVDVCGAGDTFMAAVSLHYTKFGNIQAALDFANHCCSFVVKKKGTVSIELSEVANYDSKKWY